MPVLLPDTGVCHWQAGRLPFTEHVHLARSKKRWQRLDSDPRLSFNAVERVQLAEAEPATVSENVSVKSPRTTIREN